MTRSPGGPTTACSRTWSSNQSRAGRAAAATVVAVLFTTLGGGCGPLFAEMPHVRGRWTGRVVPVEVRDRTGRIAYPAAGLEIIRGTAFGPVLEDVGGGRLPLLLRPRKGQPAVTADPGDFDRDSVYEVRGTMYILHAYEPPGRTDYGTRMMSRAFPNKDLGEHVIILCAEPRPVKP